MTTLQLTKISMSIGSGQPYPEQLRQNYFVDHDREILWIINRKNAGTSIREALGVRVMVQAVEAHQFAHYHTVTIIRHPWARLTSGLYNPYNGPLAFAERVQQEILDRPSPWHVDPHLWPQWVPILGFRVDRYIQFVNLPTEWALLQQEYTLPDLEHKNRGTGHNWRDQNFDWSLLLPWYEPDFELWKRD